MIPRGHHRPAARNAGVGADVQRGVARRAPVALLLVALALPGAASAASPQNGGGQTDAPAAAQAVDELCSRVVEIGHDGAKDTAERETVLARVLGAALDVRTLSRFVLGRYAAELDGRQTVAFRRAFADDLVAAYARLLARAEIAGIAVEGTRRITADTAAVATRVDRRNGAVAHWIWRLHRNPAGRWGVVDLRTPRASVALTYRSAFADLLDRRGVDGLIRALHARTGRRAALPAESRAMLMLLQGMQADTLALTAPRP